MISFVLGQVMCWMTTVINENNLFRSVDRTNMGILVNGDTVIQTNKFSAEKVNQLHINYWYIKFYYFDCHIGSWWFLWLTNLGCVSNDDCSDGEECDKDTNQCIPLSCRNTTGKLGGSIKMKESYDSSKWFVGDVAEFCCEDGRYIFVIF